MSRLATSPTKSTSRPSDTARRAAPASGTAATAAGSITHDAVARVAFQKWQKRGCAIGEDQRDWFEAENELKSQSARGAGR
jgi:hypothetical protein